MADDIILRALLEASQARQELEALRSDFSVKLGQMENAAKKVDFDPLSDDAVRLRREVQRVGREFVKQFNRAQKEQRETQLAVRFVRTEVNALDRDLGRLGFVKSLGGMQSALRGIQSSLAAIGLSVGVVFAAREAREFTTAAIRANIELERLHVLSATAARDNGQALQFARREAKRLGVDLFTAIEAEAKFEAATQNTNISLAEKRRIFTAVLEAGRVLNLTQQRVNNTFLALEQIASKGVVSMEELRRQLGDQLPGVLPLLAKQLGVTIGELIRMVENSELLAEVALPALATGLEETFGPGLQDALQTDAARIGMLKNVLLELKLAFAQGISDEFTKGLQAGTEAAKESEASVRALGRAVGQTSEPLVTFAARFLQAQLVVQTALNPLSLLAQIFSETADLIPREMIPAIDQFVVKTDEMTIGVRQVTEKLLEASDAQKKWQDKLIGSADDVRELTGIVLTYVESIRQAGGATAEQGEVIEKEVQKLLDLHGRLGIEVPADLQAVAAEYGVVTTIVEKETKKQEAAAKRLAKEEERAAKQRIAAMKKVGDEFARLSERLGAGGEESPLQQQLAALEAEIARLKGQELLSEEEAERLTEAEDKASDLRTEISRLGTAFGQAATQTSAAAGEINAAIDSIVRDNRELLGELPLASQEAFLTVLGNLQEMGRIGVATSDTVTGALEDVIDIFRGAGLESSDLQDQLSQLRGEGVDLRQGLEGVGDSSREAGKGMGELSEKVKAQREEQEKLLEQLDANDEKLSKLAQSAEAHMSRYAAALRLPQREWATLNAQCEAHRQCLSGAA